MVPLSITKVTKVIDEKIYVTYSHFDFSITQKNEYNTIKNVFLHGNDLVLSIKDKIKNKQIDSISKYLFRNGHSNKIYVRINRI